MASIYQEIRATLEDRLANTAGLPNIAWENVDFKPATGTSFIRTQFSPTTRRPAVRGLSPQQRYQGVFSVFIYCGENQGPSTADALAELVLESFEATTDISYTVDTNTTVIVSVDYAERQPGISQPPWYYIRCDIGWYIYN